MSAAHTPEPWVNEPNTSKVTDYHGDMLTIMWDRWSGRDINIANAARIVQCVNACAGLDDPGSVLAEVRKVLADLVHRADTTEMADGSSLDTLRAHKLLDRLGGAA